MLSDSYYSKILSLQRNYCLGIMEINNQSVLNQLGRFLSESEEEGAAEISAFDPQSDRLFVVNAVDNAINILDLSDLSNPSLISSIDLDPIGASVNSVAVGNGVIAVAVANDPEQDSGEVAFYDTSGTLLGNVAVGALPDMVTFTPDGNTVLVANEGEPASIDEEEDPEVTEDIENNPEGSVSIINVSEGFENLQVTTADFIAFNGQEEFLRSRGVRIFPDTDFAADAEPEFITVTPDGTTAYVALQENNAVAVVDIESGEVTEIQPLGTKNYQPGIPSLTNFTWDLSNEVIGTTPGGQEILLGGMSGLFYQGTTEEGLLQFIATPDRGPNGEPTDVNDDGINERPFVLPDYQPRLVNFTLDRDSGEINITEQIELFREDGETPLTGLPNLQAGVAGSAYTDEIPVDLNGNTLDNDPFGADFESIVVAPDGTYWLSDEYRPAIYHFDAEGTLIDRFIPQGTAAANEVEEGAFGTETLPAVYAQRRANRGFEALALNEENNRLYAFIQSPIDNPDINSEDAADSDEIRVDQSSRDSQILRILEVNPETGEPTAEYVYILEGSAGVDKIGDAVHIEGNRFYVIERDSGTDSDSKKFIFELNLTGATNILGTDLATATEEDALEGMTANDLAAMDITPVNKTRILNLPSIGYQAGDKPEGLALLDDGSLAVLNDNDFGLLDEEIPIDGSVPFNPEPVDIVLGLIEFDPITLDASDEDGEINLQNYPIFGLFQPDAIASYQVGEETFYITANEGDARDEDVRVADITLDPTAFPNAEELQAEDVLGRLEVSSIDGDLDGDGDYDQLYTYGGRSFSIFDSRGNLVYDSGDEFAEITSQLFPDLFNSEGTLDSFDSRSDAKGAEPEGVVIGEDNGRQYAFIGLERIGGVMTYDVSDPSNPQFISYQNPTDEAGNAIDIAPEGLTFISAEDSPNGEPALVVTNEVSNSTTIFNVDLPEPYTLQLLHASDQEGGINALTDAPNFSAVLNALRDDFENTITLSSGDAYIPSPFFSASESVFGAPGRGDILIQNELGFDAISFGNHDFDFGTGTVADLISADEEADYPGTNFPYLAANLDFSTDEDLAPLVTANGQLASEISNSIAGNTIVDVNGEKIGVFGAVTPTLSSISSPGDVGISPIEFDSENPEDIAALAAEIQDAVDLFLNFNPDVNKVILLSHMQQLSVEQQLAELLTDVDIIVAGGSNTLLADDTDTLRTGDEAQGAYPIISEAADGNPIAVVNTDGNYQYVGRLVVEFDPNGVIIPESIDPEISGAYATDEAGVAAVQGTPDPEIVEITEQLEQAIVEQFGNTFGNTEVFLNGIRADVRTEETNLGNLTADANLATAQEADETVLISIKNGGGIRDDIGDVIVPPGATSSEEFEFIPPPANEIAETEEGDISQVDIANALSFNNGLSLLTLTAEELKDVIEHGVAATAEGETPGQFPQVAGINFSFDPSLESGNRVQSLTVVDESGEIIDTVAEAGELQGDASRTFRIVTLNFLADGGDDYPFPTGEAANRVDLATEDSDSPNPESRTGDATFAPDGSEQDALAEYLLDNFEETPFDNSDTPPSGDTRIQNLAVRDDTVLGDSEDLLDTEIFRFRRLGEDISSYLFATGEEAQSIRDNFGDTYEEEGVAFQVGLEESDELLAFYRFQSNNNPGRYLYVGEDERTNINENLSESFTEEGLAFYAYGVGTGEATEFNRFRNLNSPENYLFATGEEAQSIRDNFGDTFIEEGAAFEVGI